MKDPDPHLFAGMVATMRANEAHVQRTLTPREEQVDRLLAHGLGVVSIESILGVSRQQVYQLRMQVRRKRERCLLGPDLPDFIKRLEGEASLAEMYSDRTPSKWEREMWRMEQAHEQEKCRMASALQDAEQVVRASWAVLQAAVQTLNRR